MRIFKSHIFTQVCHFVSLRQRSVNVARNRLFKRCSLLQIRTFKCVYMNECLFKAFPFYCCTNCTLNLLRDAWFIVHLIFFSSLPSRYVLILTINNNAFCWTQELYFIVVIFHLIILSRKNESYSNYTNPHQ